jgi:hypothetical protein|eukprot:TRINITY_DN63226_c0_g1_i1.p1 TRINITY_DN63226_c0_g1~~TRINITY_DN63226_c0_g1_i1.p1  ORF type:complete len:283 (-),score=29.22 TRINITY_DN63226_c0_g1_i1:163-1011(-)
MPNSDSAQGRTGPQDLWDAARRTRCGSKGRLTSTRHCTDAYGQHVFVPATWSGSGDSSSSMTDPAIFARVSMPRCQTSGDSGINFVPTQPCGDDAAPRSAPLQWYMNVTPTSLHRESWTDPSPLRAIAKPHKTSRDFNKEAAWKQALQATSRPLGGQSLTKQHFVDLSKRKEALKPPPTVYTKRDDLERQNLRASMEFRQRELKTNGKGLRSKSATESNGFRGFTHQEMIDAKTPPTFTGWHESMSPFSLEEAWTPSQDTSEISGSPCSVQRSRPRRYASIG